MTLKISTRFPIAVHILAALEYPPNKDYNTSETLAHSVNTNPVCIRRIIGQLKKAGLVLSRPGAGHGAGARPVEITLRRLQRGDVVESLFGLHMNPTCAARGANIQDVLGGFLSNAQAAMEQELQKVTMADVMEKIDQNRKK